LNWLLLFKAVPWKAVLDNAPEVAAGAHRLWKKTTRHKEEVPNDAGALTASIGELQQEVVRLSKLVDALAEQNSAMVETVRIMRVRLRMLWTVVGLACVAAAAALWLHAP
jgi:hypothetical protein